MTTTKWHFVYLFILVVLAVGIGMGFRKDVKTEAIYHTTTDTIFDTVTNIKYDTIKQTKLVCKTEREIDTLFIRDTINYMPVTQKYYSQDSVYDIWVSGIYPNLDSVNVYQKTEYSVVTKEITKTVHPQTTDWYVFAGLNAIDGTLAPKIGVSLKTKKDWLISPEIGLFRNNAFGGITIAKKIN